MALETVVKETGLAYRTQLCNLVNDRRGLSERYHQTFRSKLPELYTLYRAYTDGRKAPFKNNLSLPLILSVIQSDVARKVQTSFGGWPIVGFQGYSSEDAPIARKREALISAQMKDCNSFQRGYDLFLCADLYGTAVARWGWKHIEQEMSILRTETLPVSGMKATYEDRKRICTFDGPDWVVIDLMDYFPQPGVRLVDDMQWICEDEYLDFDELRDLAEPDENGYAMYDKSEVDRMAREGIGASESMEGYRDWRLRGRTSEDDNVRRADKYSRPVRITHMWGWIPDELTEDGVKMRIISVANKNYLLRNRAIPFWNGRKPYLAYSPMPDPHYHFAIGKAEISAKLQVVASRFTNQQLDALDMFIDPAFWVNTNLNVNTRNLLIRPGKLIPVSGNPNDGIAPVVPNFQGMQLGGQMTEMVWRWMQQGTGIAEDTVQGMGAGNRTTAREYLGRAEAVATRLLLESRIFEETFLEPLADTFVDLNRQFLQFPREVLILGASAETDEITGQPIPQTTRQAIEGWDLVPNYEAKAEGSTTRLGRSARQQNLTFLLQAAAANPIAASAVNWINFFRQVFREFEIQNVNELIQSEPEMQRVLQQTGTARADQVPDVAGTPNAVNGVANFLGQGQQ